MARSAQTRSDCLPLCLSITPLSVFDLIMPYFVRPADSVKCTFQLTLFIPLQKKRLTNAMYVTVQSPLMKPEKTDFTHTVLDLSKIR